MLFRAQLSVAIAVVGLLLSGCGNAPDTSDTPSQDDTPSYSRASFDYGPSCRVADFSRTLDQREDHYPDAVVGEGVDFHRGHPDMKSVPFDRPDPIELEYVGKVEARAFVVDHDSYADILEDGLPFEMQAFEWGGDFRANLHEIVRSEAAGGLPVRGTEDPARNDDGYAFFYIGFESVRQSLGELPLYNSPDYTSSVESIIGSYGIGYADSRTFGGYQVFSIALESLSDDESETLKSMIDRFTDPDHRLDVQGFASAANGERLPTLSFGIPVARGARPTDASVLRGEDLFATMADAPAHLAQLREAAREAADTDEDNVETGAPIDSTRRPYSDDQLRSTDMTESELEKFRCYRDFMVNAYHATTLAEHGAQRALCFEQRADDSSYADLIEPLREASSAVRERRRDCRDELIYSDNRDLCGACQMPDGATLADIQQLADPIPGYAQYRAFPESAASAQ